MSREKEYEQLRHKLKNATEDEEEQIINAILRLLNSDVEQEVTIHIGNDGEYYEYLNVPGKVIFSVLDVLKPYRQ